MLRRLWKLLRLSAENKINRYYFTNFFLEAYLDLAHETSKLINQFEKPDFSNIKNLDFCMVLEALA